MMVKKSVWISPTTSEAYNDAAGCGTGKNSAVRKSVEEIINRCVTRYNSFFHLAAKILRVTYYRIGPRRKILMKKLV